MLLGVALGVSTLIFSSSSFGWQVDYSFTAYETQTILFALLAL